MRAVGWIGRGGAGRLRGAGRKGAWGFMVQVRGGGGEVLYICI